MSETAVIDRFTIRWVVPGTAGSGAVDPARLDALVAGLLGGPLEYALLDCGIGRDEEVCLRCVVVPPVAVRWDRPDAVVLDAWSRAIGTAVHDALAGRSDRGDPDVVHYRSATHARVDLVVSSITGDLGRAWAWRQLGLWPAGVSAGAADHLLGILDGEPALIVPVFVRLAERRALDRAASTFGAAALVRLAECAWRIAGGTAPLPTGRDGAVTTGNAVPAPPLRIDDGNRGRGGWHAGARERSPAPVASEVRRLVGRSRIAAAVAAGPRWAPEVLAAWAVLAVLDAEPAVVRGGRVAGLDAAGLMSAVAEATVVDQASVPATVAPALPALVAGAAPTAPEHGPLGGLSMPEPDTRAVGGGPVAEPRTPLARTAWAGLLFLLPVLDDLEVPRRLLDDEAVTTGGLRAALHALGTALVRRCQEPGESPVAATDPALLAFCGLQPDAEQPSNGPDDEQTAVVVVASDIAAEVSRRLGQPDAAAGGGPAGVHADASPAEHVLAHVCRREGEIVADPGWLDVRLDLDGVSTDVRRAGLDLDPGYLWWLGAVVRFRYG